MEYIKFAKAAIILLGYYNLMTMSEAGQKVGVEGLGLPLIDLVMSLA